MAMSRVEIRRRYRERHPDRVRASAAKFRDAHQGDPEWRAVKRAQRRDSKRRTHDIPPDRWRGPYRTGDVPLGTDPQLDAAPFVRWLNRWAAQYDVRTYADAASRLGVSAELIARVCDGRRSTIAMSAVSRALDHTNTGMWELYDDDLAPAA